MGRRTGISKHLTRAEFAHGCGRRAGATSLQLRLAATLVLIAIPLVVGAPASTAADEPDFVLPVLDSAQQWDYTWKTSGLLSILFPRSGVGRLVIEAPVDGAFRAELRVDAKDDVYWLTGSLIDAQTLTVREIWSSYQWHGRIRTKHRVVDHAGVVDMPATILRLRQDLPEDDLPLSFQAGSTVYSIVARRQRDSVSYRLEDAADRSGERWNKAAELTFAEGRNPDPQHIALIETLIRIDLEMVSGD